MINLHSNYAKHTPLGDLTSHLHEGRITQLDYEAINLLHEIIMLARFDRPMSAYQCDDAMMIVYRYLVTHLIMMRICPFISSYPMPIKTRWHSDFNRHIPI